MELTEVGRRLAATALAPDDMTTASKLSSLPQEILDQIFTHLLDDPFSTEELWQLSDHRRRLHRFYDNHGALNPLRGPETSYRTVSCEGRKALYNLCLVSHRLYTISNPYLYHTIATPETSSEFYYEFDRRHWIGGRVHRLLRTLSGRPELAQHTRRLVLHPLAAEFWTKYQAGVSGPSRNRYKRQVREIWLATEAAESSHDKDLADHAWRCRNWRAPQDRYGMHRKQVELLCKLATNLEVLILGDCRIEPDDMVRLKWPLTQLCLQQSSLHTVVCSAPPQHSMILFDTSGQYHTARRISTAVPAIGYDHRTMPSLQVTNSVTQVLRFNNAPTTLFTPWMMACSALVSLDLTFGAECIDEWKVAFARPADLRQLRTALLESKYLHSSLQRLVIDVKRQDGLLFRLHETWSQFIPTATDLIGPLQHLTALRTLYLQQSTILRRHRRLDAGPVRAVLADVLPPNVIHLRFLDFDTVLLPQLDALLIQIPSQHPLRRLEVKERNNNRSGGTGIVAHNLARGAEDHVERVYQACAERGIEFVELG